MMHYLDKNKFKNTLDSKLGSLKQKLLFKSFKTYVYRPLKRIMTSCCACCCFYPKYKRKVDNIYPRNLDQPLIKNEVDKLQYYCTVHPEKLSKIGEYLYQNLKWGLNGAYKNKNYVKNTIEAVEKILEVIMPQNLNYYAPNYLKIIQKLLEQGGSGGTATSTQPSNSVSNNGISNTTSNGTLNSTTNDALEYQKLAAGLFQKFCEKEASNLSTVNYNLNFDQFVCQFSSMCYNNHKDERIRAEIRSSGLQCLATIVRRLVPDDNLRASYIWDNMDKIIPALLYIMHENYLNSHRNGESSVDEIDEEEIEQELAAYLYSDFYINNKIKKSVDEDLNFKENKDVNLENIKVQFKKAQVSQNSQDNANIMINLNENKANSKVIDPDHEAKMLLKNIASKADYTTIGKIVLPILAFLDDNRPNGWELAKFVRCIFLILMYNVKQQHAIVIKELIKHLDSHRNSAAKLKCYVIRALLICIKIAAMQSVGTAGQIIETFTKLLNNLNLSVEKSSNLKSNLINKNVTGAESTRLTVEINEETRLQREIIATMGQFTSHLPDYAKNDVFMHMARQINSQQFSYGDLTATGQKGNNEQLAYQVRSKYFECLHEICTKYKPSQLFSAFTASGQFLEDILKLTLVNDWASRKKAHEILHQLLDKYQIIEKIKQLKPNLFYESSQSGIVSIRASITQLHASNLSLNNAKLTALPSNLKQTRNQTYLSQIELNESSRINTSKEDVQFMRKHGRAFLSHMNENLFLANNRRENYESVYLTMCLFLVGLFREREFLIDLIRFGFHVQDLALLNHENQQFKFTLQCNVHKFVCAYFLLLSKSSGITEFYQYCSDVCDLRRKRDLFKFIYPEYILLDNALSDSGIQSTTASSSLTEIETEFKQSLTSSGKEYSKFVQEFCTQTKTDESKKSLAAPKLAPWLFDKNILDDILRKANYSTSNLFSFESEFSLSIPYLQQSIASLQSVLRFRSPYSNSFESVAGFNQTENDQPNAAATRHHRMQSGLGLSPSVNQFNQTPRRSIDVESNMDDDTSYDSVSQISMDQNGFELEPSNNQFFIGSNDNQATVNSLNLLRQQNYTDFTSFETIKRVLFNGNNAGSTLSNSGVGGAGGTSTIGPGSSIAPSNVIITPNPGASPLLATLNGQNDEQTDEQNNNRIISEFKQKPFDELKQNLVKTNQILINSEKYQQVLDLISKELALNNHEGVSSQDLSTNHASNHNLASTSSISTTASIQSSYLNANGSSAHADQFTKPVALNDIDFPQSFMS